MVSSLTELCGYLDMPAEVPGYLQEKVLKSENVQKEIVKLTDPKGYETARIHLKELLGEDPGGWKILTCMLEAMLFSHRLYEKRGISDEIFLATMKCFSRFIREHQVSYGIYGFDRDFWTGRQLSLRLFRLGELEFEIVQKKNADALQDGSGTALSYAIYVHIPGDAHLTPECCHASYGLARRFLKKYYPETEGCGWFCESWLMSPALKELLPAESRILLFQRDYHLISWDRESMAVLEWVFKRREQPPDSRLPEDTSLQRTMKRYLLDGGKIGEALAYLSYQ